MHRLEMLRRVTAGTLGAGLLIVFATLSGASRLQAEPYEVRVGARHPDFTLPSIEDGKPVSLSSFRGKKVLLFHFASW